MLIEVLVLCPVAAADGVHVSCTHLLILSAFYVPAQKLGAETTLVL